MQTEYPPHVPLTFHRGSVTNGNGQELPREAYLTYGSAAAMNDKDAEVEIHGGGAHEAARMIDAAPDMLAALLNVRKLISEAAMTGFNCKDGDWAERLFASQQVTSTAGSWSQSLPFAVAKRE